MYLFMYIQYIYIYTHRTDAAGFVGGIRVALFEFEPPLQVMGDVLIGN